MNVKRPTRGPILISSRAHVAGHQQERRKDKKQRLGKIWSAICCLARALHFTVL
jgi:hypothetical protein